MEQYQKYPNVGEVQITDSFWLSYLGNVQNTMIPYAFGKMREQGYVQNYISVAKKMEGKHRGPSFSDGLLLETMRGACDFLATRRDLQLELYVDTLIDIISAAAAEDGFLCTATMQSYPDKRWGHNGGDIVEQHDLYDHGCLIEAAISHYKATKKTTLLAVAVKAANLICEEIGYAPKKNIIPGHSLPEEAFVKLYRLFRDEKELKDFAEEYNVQAQAYLDIAEFWYDARGNHEGRCMAQRWTPKYSQDHATFALQTTAEGHSVRAMLCYLGATVVAQEKGRDDYFKALKLLWNNVVYKKLHISGGIGANHAIEGFAEDYFLPNRAYLETCAAIGLAFWNTEMNLSMPDAKYFDVFERSLYNNIMSGIGADFKHFYYQNPLSSDGTLQRWAWHGCPCCPPMLAKILSSLNSFIYSFSLEYKTVNVNMFIDSKYENQLFAIEQKEKRIKFNTKGQVLTLKIRVPEYVENFNMEIDGEEVEYSMENGYAVISRELAEGQEIVLLYDTPIRRIYANPKVEENLGKVAISYGPWVMCAEGIDNNGNVEFTIAEKPNMEWKDGFIVGKTADGDTFKLIPYGKWCNRGKTQDELKMEVWLKQENMLNEAVLAGDIDDKLYGDYEKALNKNL